MSASSPESPRVLVYLFASPFLRGAAEECTRADLIELCAKENLHLVDLVIDHGPPKHRASDYPALARVARGEADGVLVVRSLFFERGRVADRLEKLCPEGPSGWLPAAALDEAGLLPKRPKPAASRRRPPVKRRAAALSEAGLNLRQIVQVLNFEGYRNRGGAWELESAAELLGLAVMDGGRRVVPRWSPDGSGADR